MLNVNIRVVTIVVTVLLSIFSEISISSYASITTTNNNAERHLMTQLALLNQTNNTTDIKKLKIALLTDALFSDAGWGAFGYNAVQALSSKYGHEIDFKDNVSIQEIGATLREYADAGYDLIIAQG